MGVSFHWLIHPELPVKSSTSFNHYIYEKPMLD